jgi:hypothetical protein
VIVDSLELSPEAFAAGTGWQIKPEGACKADVCVPLPAAGSFDLKATAERLGGRALASAEAPELELDDLDGRPFRLSSLRGQKVLLVSWAPY